MSYETYFPTEAIAETFRAADALRRLADWGERMRGDDRGLLDPVGEAFQLAQNWERVRDAAEETHHAAMRMLQFHPGLSIFVYRVAHPVAGLTATDAPTWFVNEFADAFASLHSTDDSQSVRSFSLHS